MQIRENTMGVTRRLLMTGTALVVAATGLLSSKADALTPNQKLVLLNGRCVAAPITSWKRPSDWPALPGLSNSSQEFVGLFAVYNNGSNFVALSASGNYTVNWGDGSAAQNFSAGATANYNFSYGASGLGPLTAEGYQTAIITVTPQAGQNLTAFSLQVKNTQTGLNAYTSPWLDVAINSYNLTSLSIGGSTMTLGSLQQATVGVTGSITNFNNMFYNCYSLQSVPLFNTAAGTNFSNMFNNCYSLQSIPLFNTAAGTNFNGMVNNCYSLQSIPLFNTAAGTNFNYMFLNCYSLQSVPLFNTAAGTTFTNMFQNCSSLQSVPLFNTAAGINFSNMFQYCYSLQSVPLFNTAAGTNFSNMFQYCYSLGLATLSGTRYAISYSGCKLANTELISILNALGTASGSQTIPISGNWGDDGSAPLVTAIAAAVAKGWTVAS